MKASVRFILTIELGNDAMSTRAQLAQALRDAAVSVEDYAYRQGYSKRIQDANGNTVGEWKFK